MCSIFFYCVVGRCFFEDLYFTIRGAFLNVSDFHLFDIQ